MTDLGFGTGRTKIKKKSFFEKKFNTLKKNLINLIRFLWEFLFIFGYPDHEADTDPPK